jgi:hypothetical protein
VSKLSFKGIVAGILACGLAEGIFAVTVLFFASNVVRIHSGIAFDLLVLSNALASVIGGYVAARLAGHDEVLNGVFAVLLPVLAGLVRVAQHEWTGASIALLLIYPMGGILGGYLGEIHRSKVERRASSRTGLER